ncbi:MAG: arylsulfatase A-like enzyme [Verrucomicrobiales bacterium]|jgi:arylsulfatase A-like enzyme
MTFRIILLFSLLVSIGTCMATESKPNIVLIVSDDQGWRDYGFMGSKVVETPHLDRLASQSLIFERGYVPAPLCRPSLASILTGLYPHQHGNCGNDVDPKYRIGSDRPLRAAFHKHPSMVKALVDRGYVAFQSGKWWEGSWKDGGFTDGMTHGDPKKGGRHGDQGLRIGRDGIKPIADFIDAAVTDQKPFFVWYAPFLPHTPHDPPEALFKKYHTDGRSIHAAKYYAMCEWFDQTCGDLLGQLAKKNLTRNTLVLYVCDNGWAPREADESLPDMWAKRIAPRSKGSPFENGIRTPIMVSWPGVVTPARDQNLASSLDLFPTIAKATGCALPDALPGIDLLDEGARTSRDAIFGASYSIHNLTVGKPAETLQYRWCIAGKWKLLLRHHGSDTTGYKVVHQWDNVPLRLYDLIADPDERTNLVDEHPDTVRELTAKIAREIPKD